MLTLKEKIELALWLCNHNYNIALTGSLMLYLKYYDKKNDSFFLGREPQDIDFIMDANDEDCDNLVLPPFIEKAEIKMSEYDGYEVLARFWYKGTKVEFIETPRFRYDKDYINYDWYRDYKDKEEANRHFYEDFYNFHHNHYNIRLALTCDLINAKQEYIKVDKNEDYINKTKEDLKKIYSIYDKYYKDEYNTIIKFYLEKGWYYKARSEDEARKFVEDLIWKNEVSNYECREVWFNYIKAIDHNWRDQYINYRKSQDRFYEGYRYGSVGYDEQKLIDKMLYGYDIPFEITEVENKGLDVLSL